MTDTPWTPGPWAIDGPKKMEITGRVHRIIDESRYPAAFVPAWDRPGEGEVDAADEAQANARLIAAAPEMAEFLQVAHAYIKHTANGDMDTGVTGIAKRDLRRLDAILAKVRGEQ